MLIREIECLLDRQPLTQNQIAQKRSTVEEGIRTAKRRARLEDGALFMGVAATVTVALVSHMKGQFLSTSELALWLLFLLGFSAAISVRAGSIASTRGLHTVADLVAATSAASATILAWHGGVYRAILVALVFVAGGVIAWRLKRFRNIITRLDASLNELSDAGPESCLDIQEWLEVPKIRQWRDKVIAERRVFTRGEVEAMREYREGWLRLKEYREREAETQAACSKVYLKNPISTT